MYGLRNQLMEITITTEDPNCIGVVSIARTHYVHGDCHVAYACLVRLAVLLAHKRDQLRISGDAIIRATMKSTAELYRSDSLANAAHALVIADHTSVVRDALDVPQIVVQDTLIPDEGIIDMDVVSIRGQSAPEHLL